MAEIKLAAKKREISTKGAVNALRREGNVPGVFYIEGSEPINIYCAENSITPLVFTTETHLINLQVEGIEDHRAILQDIQFDPVTDKIIHFDLLGITAGQKMTLEVPILFVGTAPGVRAGGKLVHSLHKLNIEVLPKDLPSHLEVDISGLKEGDAIYAGDLSFDNLEILTPGGAMLISVTKARGEEAAEGEETAEGDAAADETAQEG